MAPQLQPPRLEPFHAPIHAEECGLELSADTAGAECAGDDGAPIPRQKPARRQSDAKSPVTTADHRSTNRRVNSVDINLQSEKPWPKHLSGLGRLARSRRQQVGSGAMSTSTAVRNRASVRSNAAALALAFLHGSIISFSIDVYFPFG